ncbi:hypothetical protein B0H14DRAFT_3612027 [Mycena olivaceomarginata]|nr:hypothetical protein B0H14DRAFT_3612027 [Mycena olivaceomarginata]
MWAGPSQTIEVLNRNPLRQKMNGVGTRQESGISPPILSLPLEMTAEIFTHFLPIYPLRARLVGTQSPILLSQVCRQWRNIAISLPQLWRAIQLDLGTEFQPHQINLLKSWLQRSESRLLSVGIAYNGRPSLLIEPHVETFLHELMLHRKRWDDRHGSAHPWRGTGTVRLHNITSYVPNFMDWISSLEYSTTIFISCRRRSPYREVGTWSGMTSMVLRLWSNTQLTASDEEHVKCTWAPRMILAVEDLVGMLNDRKSVSMYPESDSNIQLPVFLHERTMAPARNSAEHDASGGGTWYSSTREPGHQARTALSTTLAVGDLVGMFNGRKSVAMWDSPGIRAQDSNIRYSSTREPGHPARTTLSTTLRWGNHGTSRERLEHNAGGPGDVKWQEISGDVGLTTEIRILVPARP